MTVEDMIKQRDLHLKQLEELESIIDPMTTERKSQIDKAKSYIRIYNEHIAKLSVPN